MTTTQKQRIEATAIRQQLEAAGYEAIYGGGSRSKGHGFWVKGLGWKAAKECRNLVSR